MTKDKFNWKFYLCCGLFIWFIVNLLQGVFTEIQEDEAYYALYGEHLAWGYFDHPPMVGLMTFLSSLFFSGTLGVRSLTILASCLSLFIMWKIIDDKQPDKDKILLFFTLACSIVMFNIYGFVTTPDVGLILFSALFLLVYQRYLAESTWPRALLMGILMACMVYSKYHAFMLLGLIVLSNLKLLKDGKFYMACVVALALLMPHILWQVNADFPSFRYHLSGRNEAFRWSYFLEYLPNQLLIFNPLTFGAVVYVLLKSRSESIFERGLRFILIGFFFFFWLMSFRGHVEPHWTIVCTIPVVVLLYRKSLIDDKLRRFIKHFILPSLLLMLAFRIVLLTPLADRFGYHGKEKYYKTIETVAGDRPVAFRGSFQQPALYHYFTGKESSTLKCYYDRKTQFDLWQFDKDWTGKSVLVMGAEGDRSITYRVGESEFNGLLTERFQTANRLVTDFKITNASTEEMPVFHRGDTIRMAFTIHNPSPSAILFHHPEFDLCLKMLLLTTNDFSYCFHDNIEAFGPYETYRGQLFAIVGENMKAGKNRVVLGVGDRIATFATEEHHADIIVAE